MASVVVVGPDDDGGSAIRIYAAALATVVIAALLLRFSLNSIALGFPGGTIRFFSFFTIISNLLVAVTTSAAAFGPDSRLRRAVLQPAFAGAVALYILITGIIYHLLLSKLETLSGLDRAANIGLHYLTPSLFAVFWLLFVRKGELGVRHVFWWLVFPIGYAVVSLIRGPIVGWYPYPFIDASTLGVGRLVINIIGVTGGFFLVGLVLVGIDTALGRLRIGRAASG